MSRVLPILFNTDMVRAILREFSPKTATRRAIKGYIPNDAMFGYTEFTPKGYISCRGTFADGYGEKFIKLPCQKEDILYVRETLRVGAWDIRNQMIAFDYKDGTCGELAYIHDRKLFERLVDQSREDARKARCEYNGVDFVWEKGKSPCRWHPSIHMPKEAARIWLKVKDVRVERLQEITDEQAEKEGIRGYSKDGKLYKYAVTDNWWIDYHSKHRGLFTGSWWQDMPRTAKEAFFYLWNSTIKKSDLDRYGWDANPYVFVIEFEQCENPEVVI